MPRGNYSTNQALDLDHRGRAGAGWLGIIDNRISGPNTHQHAMARKPDTETYA